MTLSSFDATLKDMYPLPGERLKQYVVDLRREHAWERETCPRYDSPQHLDNTGARCRNEGSTPWTYLAHDCCELCCKAHEGAKAFPEVQAWLAAKAARPPICADRTKLSDEVQPDWTFAPNPLFAMLPKERK